MQFLFGDKEFSTHSELRTSVLSVEMNVRVQTNQIRAMYSNRKFETDPLKQYIQRVCESNLGKIPFAQDCSIDNQAIFTQILESIFETIFEPCRNVVSTEIKRQIYCG